MIVPIRIPDQLPAQGVLTKENIFVMGEARATNQGIRPIQLGILNLMPNKIETEIQLLRLLSNTPLQINVDLIRVDSVAPKNTPQAHMDAFYTCFDDIADKKYDGLIITGAPLGLVDYEEVVYWEKFQHIMDWSATNVQSTLFLCWAAHAALYQFYGLNRQIRPRKLSGVYEHQVVDTLDELTRGFDHQFWACHSRVGEVSVRDYESINALNIVATSDVTGPYIVASKDKRQVYVTGHPEYDPDTLADEYHRDIAAGLAPTLPEAYFHADDPEQGPILRWRSHGSLLLTNWLNYYVYQVTPYDLSQLG